MVQDLLSVDLSMLEAEAEEGELEGDMITEEVERKFLTLSWWILHVGWKDVGERVRRGVEEVFEGFVHFAFRHRLWIYADTVAASLSKLNLLRLIFIV